MVRLFLDDIEYLDIPDLKEFEEVLSYDEDLHGFAVKYPLDLVFFGDAYRYIKERKREFSFCKKIQFKLIYKPANTYINTRTLIGYIILADTKENLTKKTIECSIIEDNIGAIIKQNAKVPFSCFAEKTRNGEPLTPLSLRSVTFFNPANSVNYPNDKRGFDFREAFENLILFLSDNKLQFKSDFLDIILLDWEQFLLTTGAAIRTHTIDPDFVITFKDMMDFSHNVFNLHFWIEYDGVMPVFRLEQEIHSEGNSIEINLIKDIEQSYFQDRMYSTIKLGGDAIADRTATYALPDLSGLAFKKETYYLIGDCAIDAEKDITLPFIADTNRIQRQLMTGTDNDTDVFIVQYDKSLNDAIKGNYLSGSARGYNELLLNVNVVNRHCLYNDAAIILGNGVPQDNEFKASLLNPLTQTPPALSIYPFPFDDEIYDYGGNYNDTLYRYVAPANGLYGFEVNFDMLVTIVGNTGYLQPTPNISFTITFFHRDSGGGLKSSFVFASDTVSGATTNSAINIKRERSIYMEGGDYVEVNMATQSQFTLTGTSVTYKKSSYFKTIFTLTGGGVIAAGKPDDCKMLMLEFERGIPLRHWDSVVNNPTKYLLIDNNGINKTKTWVKEIKCKLLTGECNFSLITDVNNFKM